MSVKAVTGGKTGTSKYHCSRCHESFCRQVICDNDVDYPSQTKNCLQLRMLSHGWEIMKIQIYWLIFLIYWGHLGLISIMWNIQQFTFAGKPARNSEYIWLVIISKLNKKSFYILVHWYQQIKIKLWCLAVRCVNETPTRILLNPFCINHSKYRCR